MGADTNWINDWPHAANWFEIPCDDFDRARAFYGALYEIEMPTSEMPTSKGEPMQMAFFPTGKKAVGGAVVKFSQQKPKRGGVLLYLAAGRDLTAVMNRIEPAGGKIVVPKTKISDDHGYFAIFLDTEGNELALHSPE